MPIVNIKAKLLDKLYILWALCLVVHQREHNKSVSYNAVKQEYGDRIADLYLTYRKQAHDFYLLDANTMQLTPKGLTAVAYWKQINQRLLEV